jgi:hypothetical protein
MLDYAAAYIITGGVFYLFTEWAMGQTEQEPKPKLTFNQALILVFLWPLVWVVMFWQWMKGT